MVKNTPKFHDLTVFDHFVGKLLIFYYIPTIKGLIDLVKETMISDKGTLRKIVLFQLISWCGNFVERHSFRIVLGDLPNTMRKLCLSTKFPHQKIG